MTTCPGDLWFGMVSERLSWVVKPLAAQDPMPRAPLPSGIEAVGFTFGEPRARSERLTTLVGSRWNEPVRHAVVGPLAAWAVDACAGRPATVVVMDGPTRQPGSSPW
jgi:hypothetical protein